MPEPSPDVRALMSSPEPQDWVLALRQPGVTSEDLDFLAKKLWTIGPQGPATTHTIPLAGLQLMARHPQLRPEHIHYLLAARKRQRSIDDRPKPANDFNTLLQSPRFDATAMDMVLDEPDARNLHGTYDTGPLTDHPSFGPNHLNRLLDLAARGKETGVQALPNLHHFMERHQGVDPAHLHNWLEWGLKHRDVPGNSHLVERLAQHPQLSDKSFETLATSDHARRDNLRFRQMSDSQLKSFLSDPRFQDPTESLYHEYGQHQMHALQRQKRLSQENLDLAARSPHSGVRAAVAAHDSTPAELLQRLSSDSSAEVRAGLAQNQNVSPQILHGLAVQSGQELKDSKSISTNHEILNAVAAHPKTQAPTLEWLLDKENLLRREVGMRVAAHPNLTATQQQRLATDPDYDTVATLLQRPDINPEIVRKAFTAPRKGRHAIDVQHVVLNNKNLSRHLGEAELRQWFDAGSNHTAAEALRHPQIPAEALEKYLADPAYRHWAVQNPKVGAQRLHQLIAENNARAQAPSSESEIHGSRHFGQEILRNPNITSEHLQQTLAHPSEAVQAVALSHSKATPELIRSVYNGFAAAKQKPPQSIQDAIANSGKTPVDVAKAIVEAQRFFDAGPTRQALAHPDIDDEFLRQQLKHPVVFDEAHQLLQQRSPDSVHPGSKVGIRLGVGKLRRIRDLIWEKSPERGEVKPKELPPGDWSVGRTESGDISAKKLQQHIDAQPQLSFNTGAATWDGAQRHNEEPSQVFQVNLTNDHVQKMREAGVYPTFLRMQKLSEQSGHPVSPHHTIGWVRYTGDAKKGIHIDEIQSDFGQSFVRQAKAQAQEAGEDEEEACQRAEAEYPEAHFKAISGILFGGRHPNEVVGEAFVQHLRDKKLDKTPLHIHDAATKAPLSGMDPEKPLPGHMAHTYRDLPKKMGMQPSTYGKLETQDNPELKGKPTWAGTVRKSETHDHVQAVKAALDDDLRHPRYRGNPDPLAGHCYVASEALYHIMGGAAAGWVPQQLHHEGDSHWYLKNRDSGEIVDATASQFKTPPPYERGRGKGFLTSAPSARAMTVIARARQYLPRLKKFEADVSAWLLSRCEPLEKMGAMSRLAPFNPAKLDHRLLGQEETDLANWQGDGGDGFDGGASRDVASMSPAVRTRALHRLSGVTHVRRNAATGGREFLLHRGMAPTEYRQISSKEDIDHPEVLAGTQPHHLFVNHHTSSSWTPRYATARNFARQYAEPNNRGGIDSNIVSAWVPEASISMVPRQLGQLDAEAWQSEDDENYKPKLGPNGWSSEHEVIVDAGHNSRVATPEELLAATKPVTTLHGRINQAGREVQKWGDEHHPARTKEMQQRLQYRKSEQGLEKMAIGDIPPGKKTRQKASQPGFNRYDYSHVLPEEHQKAGYKLYLDVNNDPAPKLRATISHPKDKPAKHHGNVDPGALGQITGVHGNTGLNTLTMGAIDVRPQHQGKGFGTALYEALYAHAKHHLGADTVEGKEHSSQAHALHQKLSQKHGLAYSANPNISNMFDDPVKNRAHWEQHVRGQGPDSDGGYDDAYGPYKYALKSENCVDQLGLQHRKSEQDLEKMGDLIPLNAPAPTGKKYRQNAEVVDARPDFQQKKDTDTVAAGAPEQGRPLVTGIGGEKSLFDYSHHLPAEARAQGYGIHISHSPGVHDDFMSAHLFQNGEEVDSAWSYPNSISENHRDRNHPLGPHLFSALKQHAKSTHYRRAQERLDLAGKPPEPVPDRIVSGTGRLLREDLAHIDRYLDGYQRTNWNGVPNHYHDWHKQHLDRVQARLTSSMKHAQLAERGLRVIKTESPTNGDQERNKSNTVDQLGLGAILDEGLAAAQWLHGGEALQPADLRKHVIAEPCLDTAILLSMGSDLSEKDHLALEGIRSLKKTEPTPAHPPTSIRACTDSAKPVEAALRRAFHLGRVQNISLGGKHSGGSMLAQDPQSHQQWLLKPGSGGQSPAAGIRQEIASQARREACFYHVALLWGLGSFVPKAEVLTMDGHDWAAINFLDWKWKNLGKERQLNPVVVEHCLDRYRSSTTLHRWACLDYVLGNADRHEANLMLGLGGDVKLIDHGSAFAGTDFAPGRDPNTFIPFYLRYRGDWPRLSQEERLMVMPQLLPPQEQQLRQWVLGLDPERLQTVLRKDGIDPEPSQQRLLRLQELAHQEGFQQQLHRLWLGLL